MANEGLDLPGQDERGELTPSKPSIWANVGASEPMRLATPEEIVSKLSYVDGRLDEASRTWLAQELSEQERWVRENQTAVREAQAHLEQSMRIRENLRGAISLANRHPKSSVQS